MKYIIVGLARNIAHCWEQTNRSLLKIQAACGGDCVTLIVESNSTDGTRDILKAWEGANKIVLNLGELSEPVRTKRIAQCRNAYMDFFESHGFFDSHGCMIVVDLDTSLEIEDEFKQQLESCFVRDDWDAIASNRRGRYYDIWALRSEALGCTFDCWEMANRLKDVDKYIRRFQKPIYPKLEWIPCTSAFGCMALYKTQAIRGKRYNGDRTCEHVSFNKDLRMFIHPGFISGGECLEHL
jgi:hypothetical protein